MKCVGPHSRLDSLKRKWQGAGTLPWEATALVAPGLLQPRTQKQQKPGGMSRARVRRVCTLNTNPRGPSSLFPGWRAPRTSSQTRAALSSLKSLLLQPVSPLPQLRLSLRFPHLIIQGNYLLFYCQFSPAFFSQHLCNPSQCFKT